MGKYEEKMERVTGVVHDWKKASLADRKLIKDQVAAMDADLNKAITRAIQIGEAKAKAVEDEAMANTEFEKKELLTTVSQQADIKVGKSEGVGAGASTLPLLFSGKTVTIKNPVNQINWLVNEYTETLAAVQARWPSGLGKYL